MPSPTATGPFARNSLALLQAALDYWTTEQHFAYVDLPWAVPASVVDQTRPAWARDISTPHGVLVASGEQSFLELHANGWLAPSHGYVGWTPCFRDERVLSATHQFGFMKAELFVPAPTLGQARIDLYEMVAAQNLLFSRLAVHEGIAGLMASPERVPAEAQSGAPSHEQVDLMIGGIEVGSYGIRDLAGGGFYVYGTALALPRFHHALGIHVLRAPRAMAAFSPAADVAPRTLVPTVVRRCRHCWGWIPAGTSGAHVGGFGPLCENCRRTLETDLTEACTGETRPCGCVEGECAVTGLEAGLRCRSSEP